MFDSIPIVCIPAAMAPAHLCREAAEEEKKAADCDNDTTISVPDAAAAVATSGAAASAEGPVALSALAESGP